MAAGLTGKCGKAFLIIFNLLFWGTGIGLLCFGVWMLVDPERSVLTNLVNFSEDDPLLKYSAWIFIGCGCISIVVGFIGCCGALKEVQCMLGAYIIFLVLLLSAEIAAASLAAVFRNKFTDDRMESYMLSLTKKRYGQTGWVTELVDMIQYYISESIKRDLKALIKEDYANEETAQSAGVVKLIDKLQFHRECCGSRAPTDYNLSWWQTNRSLGSKLYVPVSCCKQSPEARPPNAFRPIDEGCTFQYQYESDAFISSVHQEGCHQKLSDWFHEYALIFIIVGVSIGAFQILGIIFSIILCRNVSVDNEY